MKRACPFYESAPFSAACLAFSSIFPDYRTGPFGHATDIQQAGRVSHMMKQHGKGKLLNAADWPSFVEIVRPIYEDFELAKLFENCTPFRGSPLQVLSDVRIRDAEGRFATWRDVDFKHMAVRVTAKPHWGFHPKNWEEREVPVPRKLIALLEKSRPAKARPDDPIFPSLTGNPNRAMLEKLSRLSRKSSTAAICRKRHELDDSTLRVNRCSEGPY